MDSITDFETTDDSGILQQPSEPAAPVETPAAPVTAESPEPPPDPEPEPELEPERDRSGRFRRTRHSAKHDARPEDVPRIQEFCRSLKDTEAKLLAKIEALEKAQPTAPALPAAEFTPTPTAAFDVPMPKLEDFLQAEDPYGELLLAKADWRQAKRAAEWQGQQVTQRGEQQAQAAAAQWQQMATTYQGRVQEFVKTHPDFTTKLDGLKDQLVPPVVQAVIYTDDNGPELVYKLLDRPDVLAAAHLLGEGKPVTADTVASAQRWLRGQLSAAGTGSAPLPTPVTIGPRPPNPVRTGPTTLGDATSTDSESLDDHVAGWEKGRRRR